VARTKTVPPTTWVWRRWIAPDQQEGWISRLEAAGCTTWTATKRPDRVRILLAVYQEGKTVSVALQGQFGGQVRPVKASEWLTSGPVPPTRIGSRLEIIHEKPRYGKKRTGSQLYIPHGLAFGSGEHGTTYMLLRELARRADWYKTTVLDLGTGSGVLALTARLFGARKIVATDFDADAVRTARENEMFNFPRPMIHWRRADVKVLRPTTRYDLVLANLFSGILSEAAAQIAACVVPGGQLWLSGVLGSQERQVAAAYRGKGLRLTEARHRGKWVMLQWTRPT
jgi:ribosomal protein L11 methyltransferase